MSEAAGVYAAIAAVMADVGKEGIAKDRRNEQQKYRFRGIDDVYNALAPILAKHHLIIVPRVLSREKSERVTIKNDERYGPKESILFYVVVQVEFDIICATDGSKHVAATWGEAMDSGDKATNKAMSAAYKYMAMQTFCIPTEGDNDADATTHDQVRPNAGPSQPPARAQQATGADAKAPPASAPVQTLSKGDARDDFKAIVAEIRACADMGALKAWGAANVKRVQLQPKDWQGEIRNEYSDRKESLEYMADSNRDAERVYEER